jgi:glycosyltransferase involved in cell wall biosynthesis
MRIWLITVGEPLPIDPGSERPLRTGILADVLVSRGHDVVWWTSTFDHIRKVHRFNTNSSAQISPNFRLKLLHSIAYSNNVSLRRIINHMGIARKFKRLSGNEAAPEIILCSLPTIELSLAAARYGQRQGVPVILDIRDQWPDIFVDLAPSWTRILVRAFLKPLFTMTHSACAQATAITGMTPAYVHWGAEHAGRDLTALDRVFPFGYSEQVPSGDELRKAEAFWKLYGLSKGQRHFVVCFFGAMSRQFDLETVINAARKLQFQDRPFRFILCGSGDNLEHYKELATDCANVVFPGWVGAPEIWTLMRRCSVGLAPYRGTSDFMASLPNKPIEYFSAGLPVISSLKGYLEQLLSENNCGVHYENGTEDQLVSILCDLYDHPGRLKTLSKNAYALYKEKFVAETVYGDMADYLEMVAAMGIDKK